MMKFWITVALSAMLAMCVMSASIEQDQVDEYGLLKDFEHFIARYGHDALSFLKCMGPSVLHCHKEILGCLAAHSVPGCIGALKCEGHDAAGCVHHLKEEHAKAGNTTAAPGTTAKHA